MSLSTSPSLLCVMTTAPADAADALARGIVEHRLAACVQRLSMQSTYWWQGDVQNEPEVLLLCKTTDTLWPELCTWLADAHPYAVPQIAAVPITAAWPAWAAWLQAETRSVADRAGPS